MVDTRFHHWSGPVQLSDLLAATGRPMAVDDPRIEALTIIAAEELGLADGGEIALASSRDYLDQLRHTTAGAVVVKPEFRDQVPPGTLAIVAQDAHDVFVDFLEFMYPANTRNVVAASAMGGQSQQTVEKDVIVGANVEMGPDVAVGRGSVIGPNTVIGAGVTIGRNSVIGANCTIDCAHLGNNVVLHAGARIGNEGFGWLDYAKTNRKIPQLGRVIIQDKVEIGANTTIDRGALGDTVIGEGTKIDNLVHIGHNCHIGRYCMIVATSALSGATIVGDNVILAGGVATAGHLSIGSRSVVQAWGGVTKSWPAGSRLAGFPAQDIKDWLREIAAMRRFSKGDDR